LARGLVSYLAAVVRPSSRLPSVSVDRRGRKQDQPTEKDGDEDKEDEFAPLHSLRPSSAPSPARFSRPPVPLRHRLLERDPQHCGSWAVVPVRLAENGSASRQQPTLHWTGDVGVARWHGAEASRPQKKQGFQSGRSVMQAA
jgi:hypothetical protein